MFTIITFGISMLSFTNQHLSQNTAEGDRNAILILQVVVHKILDKLKI